MFLDANILFSAAYCDSSPARLLFQLAERGLCELVTSEFALDEATRNIALKRPSCLPDLRALMGQVHSCPAPTPAYIGFALAQGLPEKDAPILGAAAMANTTILITGDRRHFGHLYGQCVGGVQVLTLNDAFVQVLDFLEGNP